MSASKSYGCGKTGGKDWKEDFLQPAVIHVCIMTGLYCIHQNEEYT